MGTVAEACGIPLHKNETGRIGRFKGRKRPFSCAHPPGGRISLQLVSPFAGFPLQAFHDFLYQADKHRHGFFHRSQHFFMAHFHRLFPAAYVGNHRKAHDFHA